MTPKGMGLVEFRANLEVITQQRNQGYTKKYIHEHLAGKITLSYAQFARIWSREFNEKPETKKKNIASQPQSRTPPTRDIFRKESKVLHNPSMTDERRKELF